MNYLSSHEVAKLINASPSAVLNWIDDGLLPAFRTPGGHRRVRHTALIKFLRYHEMPVPAALAGVSRVLIVDQDVRFLRRTKTLLKKHAPTLTVETTENILDALFLIGLFRPDVVLAQDGLIGPARMDLCKRLKANEETKNITVIALSPKKARVKPIEGVERYLAKPLDTQALLNVLGVK